MLPDADDLPAFVAELAGYALVAGHVFFAFAVPEGAVGFRTGVALGAAVPETSIDEHSYLLLGKGKVGLSGQRRMPPPAANLVLLKQRKQDFLR